MQPISEGELIQIVKRNLKGGIFRMIYPMNVSSMEQLRMECVRAEKTCVRPGKRSVSAHQNRNLRVNQLDNETYGCKYYEQEPIQEVSENQFRN